MQSKEQMYLSYDGVFFFESLHVQWSALLSRIKSNKQIKLISCINRRLHCRNQSHSSLRSLRNTHPRSESPSGTSPEGSTPRSLPSLLCATWPSLPSRPSLLPRQPYTPTPYIAFPCPQEQCRPPVPPLARSDSDRIDSRPPPSQRTRTARSPVPTPHPHHPRPRSAPSLPHRTSTASPSRRGCPSPATPPPRARPRSSCSTRCVRAPC